MTHTVIGYRQKHKKCKYCKFVSYPKLLPTCEYSNSAFCLAKIKYVNDEIPRPFCKIFSVRKRGVDNG